MSEELIPKDLKVKPMKSKGTDVAALNALLKTLNNPAITGAQVPAGEVVQVAAPVGESLLPAPETRPEPANEPPPAPTQPPLTRELEAAIAKVRGAGNRPLMVLTGASSVGKSYLQAKLGSSRNVVAGLRDAADFRALRAAGAEFWHVMASEPTLGRRRASATVRRPADPLAATLDGDARAKLAKLPKGQRLHIIWNDTAKMPNEGMYTVADFLNEVS